MTVAKMRTTPSDTETFPEPTAEQIALIARLLAPRVLRARAERAEQQSAA
ncbi:hypothetical protein AB0H73_00130 [Streptomyces olivoreticuli]